MTTQKLTKPIIEAAIAGFESQRAKLAEQISELRAMLNGRPVETAAVTSKPAKRKRKKFSAAARRKMAMAQKARWAKLKGQSAKPLTVVTSKPKRKLSKAGRAAIVAALKKRWAAKKAA